jgi:hypothetical protein
LRRPAGAGQRSADIPAAAETRAVAVPVKYAQGKEQAHTSPFLFHARTPNRFLKCSCSTSC